MTFASPDKSGQSTNTMLRILTIGLAILLALAAIQAAETLPATTTRSIQHKDLAGPEDGLLPGTETSVAEAMKGQVTLVALCQAVEPARLEPGFSGVIHATQTFRIIESFYEHEKPATTITIRYSYLQPGTSSGQSGRAIRADEKVIWILHHDGFGGDRGVKALPDTPENRHGVSVMVAQLPANLRETVEDAKAEARLTKRLLAIKPKGWSVGSMSGREVEPLDWPAASGMRLQWSTMDEKPETKLGRTGEVIVWIMDTGYAGKRGDDAIRGTQAPPAVEIAPWRGRRVFFWSAGEVWPSARADILQALAAEDGEPRPIPPARAASPAH